MRTTADSSLITRDARRRSLRRALWRASLYWPVVVAALGGPPSASAHHSAVSFDVQHPVTATGVVKSFQWSNPHTWLRLMVPNATGGVDEWEIEGPSVGTLVRQHWTSTTLTPGEKVHVLMARRKDSTAGGSFMQVTREDGEVLSTGRL